MAWFAEQVNERRLLNEEDLENAYSNLAASVAGRKKVPLHFRMSEIRAIDSAVARILKHYNVQPGEAPADVDNISERLDYLLRPAGVMTRPVRLEGTWWHDITGAYMGRLKEKAMPVAILPAGIRGYAYTDPTTAQKVVINKHTASALEPDALCFYRPLPEGTLTATEAALFMLRSLGTFDYVVIILATLVATLAGMATTVGTKLLFGTVIPSGSVALIMPIACLFLGMIVSRALFMMVSALLNARISGKLKLQTEAAVYARILLLHASFFKDRAPGEVASRVMGIPSLVNALSKTVFELGLAGFMSLLYILQILRYAPELALPALITLLVELLVAVVALKCIEKHKRVEMREAARLSGVTPEVLHGVQKIKLGGAEARAFAYWANAYAKTSRATYNWPAILLSAPVTIPLIASIGTIAIYAIAAKSGVASDSFMTFNFAFGAASGAVSAFAAGVPYMAMIGPWLEQLEPILQAPPESLGSKKQVDLIEGSIEVHDLSFKYGENLPLVLHDISFAVQPGDYVAIVGSTGCGKSTLMRLLLGFEQPTHGSVQYGQYDLANVDVRSLRRNIGVVMQEGTLFNGDLYSNITVSNPRATMADAWEAAEMACIADDIHKMPMGMHTLVGANGGGFSGGQRQRLMIARAVCGRPSILMFDEATSSLDNVSQKHVSDALAKLDCTRIVIAHRLSTIRGCDRIIMLDGGSIVEDGSYDELIARGGPFANLVERQRLEGVD